MCSQHNLAPVLLNPSTQCIHNSFGSAHWVVNGAAWSVPLHQHESHFSTYGVLGQHTTAHYQKSVNTRHALSLCSDILQEHPYLAILVILPHQKTLKLLTHV